MVVSDASLETSIVRSIGNVVVQMALLYSFLGEPPYFHLAQYVVANKIPKRSAAPVLPFSAEYFLK